MPPLTQTRSELIRCLATFIIAALAAPLERLAAVGRRAFELPPRRRLPVHSVRRDG